MTCCVLKSSVVACIMSGESVPLATGEGCRVLFCVVLCCPFVSRPLESCLEAFFISSVGYMPYCPVVFRPVSRCFVTCCYETGLLAIYPTQPMKDCARPVKRCHVRAVKFRFLSFFGVKVCMLADVQAGQCECLARTIRHKHQQNV